jgi:hypothetical protein
LSNLEIEFVSLLLGVARAMTEVLIRDAIDQTTVKLVNDLHLALYQATGNATLAGMEVSKDPRIRFEAHC